MLRHFSYIFVGVHGWLQALSQGDYSENDWKLTFGAILVERMRAAVYEKTGFRCSAGISNNKMLAKLACGIPVCFYLSK